MQVDSLEALGWDDRWREAWSVVGSSDTVPGRVVRTSRRFTYVATGSGIVAALASIDADPAPVAGDWVALRDDGPEGSEQIMAVAERRSLLTRADPGGGSGRQVLAANVDVVLVIHGLDRDIKPGRIERSLVLARDGGADAAVVLTKADVAGDPRALDEAVAQVTALAADAPVLVVSSASGDGIDELRALLDDHRTLVLMGESGAGKSSLLNRLAGREVQRTGEVRAGDAKGRHTTVTRDLVVLPTGGIVIDSPGLRGLGLVDADDGLAATFPEIDALTDECRFRDCRHDAEPGCAVRSAVGAGELDEERVGRWRSLQHELDEAAARGDEAARREQRRADRVQHRTMRRFRSERGY
jgi:ribosome biogenesis GTPase